MNKIQKRIELQGALQEWITDAMTQYGFSAPEMEDALAHAMLHIKNQVMQEFLAEQREMYLAQQREQQSQKVTSKEVVEEDGFRE